MDTNNLYAIDIKPLSKNEMKDIDGGAIPIAAYFIGCFVLGVIAGYIIGTA